MKPFGGKRVGPRRKMAGDSGERNFLPALPRFPNRTWCAGECFGFCRISSRPLALRPVGCATSSRPYSRGSAGSRVGASAPSLCLATPQSRPFTRPQDMALRGRAAPSPRERSSVGRDVAVLARSPPGVGCAVAPVGWRNGVRAQAVCSE